MARSVCVEVREREPCRAMVRIDTSEQVLTHTGCVTGCVTVRFGALGCVLVSYSVCRNVTVHHIRLRVRLNALQGSLCAFRCVTEHPEVHLNAGRVRSSVLLCVHVRSGDIRGYSCASRLPPAFLMGLLTVLSGSSPL